MPLHAYQETAVTSVLDTLSGETKGTLVCMATGLGKTIVACEVIRRWLSDHPKTRVLFLAHRDELIQQAAHRIDQWVGFEPDIEKAEVYDARERAVCVASIPTLSQVRRLSRYEPSHFSLVIGDEIHHGTSDSWKRVFEHFTGAKRLGLTATPTRADGKKLGQEWETIAYDYGLHDAIRDGFLVPIRRRLVHVGSLSLDGIATQGGDLVQSQLEERVLKDEATVHAWARGILDAAPNRKVLAFCPGVQSSQRLAEILNRYVPEVAAHVDGTTPIHERRSIVSRYDRGEIRILSNCAVFLEGFDIPSIDCIAMCKPTKSSPLYIQCLGRGTRLFEGKTDLLVIDFTTNSVRHDLVTAVDILCDGETEEIQKYTENELQKEPDITIDEAIRRARSRQEAETRRLAELEQQRALMFQRAGVKATARVMVVDLDKNPDLFLGVNRFQVSALARRFGAQPLTTKQNAWLERCGFTVEDTDEGRALARARLNKLAERTANDLCTFKQAKILSRYGLPTDATFQVAHRIIDRLAAARWRPSAQVLSGIALEAAGRQPGCDDDDDDE